MKQFPVIAMPRGGERFSLSRRERAGVRILRNEAFRTLNPCNLKMRKLLIFNMAILSFMGRGNLLVQSGYDITLNALASAILADVMPWLPKK